MSCFIGFFFFFFFLLLVFLYFIFFCFSFYLWVLMEKYSSEDGIASIEAKIDFLIHHLNQRIQNDSLMEQGVLPYQMSSTLTFQKEEELFLAKE